MKLSFSVRVLFCVVSFIVLCYKRVIRKYSTYSGHECNVAIAFTITLLYGTILAKFFYIGDMYAKFRYASFDTVLHEFSRLY